MNKERQTGILTMIRNACWKWLEPKQRLLLYSAVAGLVTLVKVCESFGW